MDPLTLFALANGAVSAVKAGCKLYKDIKGAAGDVKDVLKDLDDQFHNAYEAKGKKPSSEAVKQLNAEKLRVKELNKRNGETTNIYQEIGNHLGTYYNNYYRCLAVFEEEEKRASFEVYTGDDSLGKRALQRVLMQKQLIQMQTELREIMVYQCPAELGALYTEVEEMMKELGKRQKILVIKQMQNDARKQRLKNIKRKKLKDQAIICVGIVTAISGFVLMMMYVVVLRQQMYPQYGNEFIPKTEEQRRRESQPQIYIGR